MCQSATSRPKSDGRRKVGDQPMLWLNCWRLFSAQSNHSHKSGKVCRLSTLPTDWHITGLHDNLHTYLLSHIRIAHSLQHSTCKIGTQNYNGTCYQCKPSPKAFK